VVPRSSLAYVEKVRVYLCLLSKADFSVVRLVPRPQLNRIVTISTELFHVQNKVMTRNNFIGLVGSKEEGQGKEGAEVFNVI
jgi:hypothetical protein